MLTGKSDGDLAAIAANPEHNLARPLSPSVTASPTPISQQVKAKALVAKPPRPAKSPLRYQRKMSPETALSECRYATSETGSERNSDGASSMMSAAPSLSDCYSLSSGGYGSLDGITPSRTRAGSFTGMDPIDEHNEDAGLAFANLYLHVPTADDWSRKWLPLPVQDCSEHVETIAPMPVRLAAPGRIDLEGLQSLSPNALGLRSLSEPSGPSRMSSNKVHGLGFEALDTSPALNAQNSSLWRPNMYDPIVEDEEEPFPDFFEPRPAAPRSIGDVRPTSSILDCISPLDLSENQPDYIPLTSIRQPVDSQDARALRFFRSDNRRTAENAFPIGVMQSPPLETIPLPNPYSPFPSPSLTRGNQNPVPKPSRLSTSVHFTSKLFQSANCPTPPSLLRARISDASPPLPGHTSSPRFVDPFPSPNIPFGPSSGPYPPPGISRFHRNYSAGDVFFQQESYGLLGPRLF